MVWPVATGSNPFIIPLPGHDKAGVVAFRDIADINVMLDAAKSYVKAVVIGGGLLGQHDLGDAGHGDEARIASLGPEAEICGCNGGVMATSSMPSPRRSCSHFSSLLT